MASIFSTSTLRSPLLLATIFGVTMACGGALTSPLPSADSKDSGSDDTDEATGTDTDSSTGTDSGTDTNTSDDTSTSASTSTETGEVSAVNGWLWRETAAGSSVSTYEVCSYGGKGTACFNCSVHACKDTDCVEPPIGGDPSDDSRCVANAGDPETEASWKPRADLHACVKVSPCEAYICYDTRKRCEDAHLAELECAVGQADFSCKPVTQGEQPGPGETAPEVCGCFAACTDPLMTQIISASTGTWPDGSAKGTSACSTEVPP